MRTAVAVLLVPSLCLPSLLFSQAATRVQAQTGMQTERTRELGSLASEGRAPEKESADVPWKSLSTEAADDPTAPAAPTPDVPKDARKAAKKAEHLSKKGDHQAAVAEFRNALIIDPAFYEAENNLALEYEALGDRGAAEKTLRHLQETAPAHTLGMANLAVLLCEEHRYAEAEAVARHALASHRFSFKSNYLLGSALVNQGRFTSEARTALEYAQVRYPEAKSLLERWPASPASK